MKPKGSGLTADEIDRLYARNPRADWHPEMNTQAWDMRKLTPWEHDLLVAHTKVKLELLAQGAAH